MKTWIRAQCAAYDLWELEPSPIRRSTRVALSCCIALASAVFAYWQQQGQGALDFTWPLEGARQLLYGANPYLNYHLGPWEGPLRYPLPALLVSMLFTPLPVGLAGPCFSGVSAALLAYGAMRRGFSPLLVFTSYPYVAAIILGQWSPLIMAAVLLPWLYPLVLTKPTLGIVAVAAFPHKRGLIATAIVFVITIMVAPSYFMQCLANTRMEGAHFWPLLVIPGPFLLMAVLYRRLPSARLLLALASVPQLLAFYDQVLLFLIPRTTRQYLFLTGASWVCFGIWKFLTPLWFPSGTLYRSTFFWDVVLDLSALCIVVVQYYGWHYLRTRGQQFVSYVLQGFRRAQKNKEVLTSSIPQ